MRATPLTLDQVRNVVERRGGDIPRPPLFWHKYMGKGTMEKYGEPLQRVLDDCVDDIIGLHFSGPGKFEAPEGAHPDYRWAIEPDPGDLDQQGITSRHVVSSTELIDPFIEAMPDPTPSQYYDGPREAIAKHPDRYLMGWDFFCLFERAWFLFGMEEIMCEMLENPDRMKRLLRAFTDYHKKVMTGYHKIGAHGYFTSDDLGGQIGLLFSYQNFKDLYLPFYEEMVAHCHDCNMHFWLHSCGKIDRVLDDLIAIGVDVIHPIQAGAMNQQGIAQAYRGKISFMAGIDVQDLVPRGTAPQVEAGTRLLIDTFDHEEGGCILAAGNGIMPETPIENINAWLQTAQHYGTEHRKKFKPQA